MSIQAWINKKIGYHGEQAIEKHFSCNEDGIISGIGRNHQQAIDSPAETSHEGQCVANGREMEHEMTIKNHCRHSQTGDDGAYDLKPRDMLRMAIDDGEEQHRKERTGTDNE